ncbi:hypothetical protein SMICM17S_01323 [Streptomyces microflavus]
MPCSEPLLPSGRPRAPTHRRPLVSHRPPNYARRGSAPTAQVGDYPVNTRARNGEYGHEGATRKLRRQLRESVPAVRPQNPRAFPSATQQRAGRHRPRHHVERHRGRRSRGHDAARDRADRPGAALAAPVGDRGGGARGGRGGCGARRCVAGARRGARRPAGAARGGTPPGRALQDWLSGALTLRARRRAATATAADVEPMLAPVAENVPGFGPHIHVDRNHRTVGMLGDCTDCGGAGGGER